MTITMDDILTVNVRSSMIKRASELAEKKLGFRYERGQLIKTGEDRVYNRYNYPRKDRWKKIYLGEMAEEACKTIMDSFGINYICYNDVREDDYKDDDPFDFKVKETRIDLKSSKDNRDHGLEEILIKQHLVTPVDQSAKDITIQAFISNDEKKVWFVGWATEAELRKPENIGYLHWQPGKYYLLNLKECRPIKELGPYLKEL